MSVSLRTRLTRATLRSAISSIPQELGGGGSEGQEILNRCGQVILDHIRYAFRVKSAGGTDDAGDRWAPLKPATVAYTRSGRTRTEQKRSARPSQALSARQQKRWWELYRQGLAIHRGDKASAAKWAWTISKREGATTLIGKYGGRRVPILYNTGALFDSITSKVSKNEVTISSSHPAAGVHHRGSRKKGIPQRRLWPDPSNWPAVWWSDMLVSIRDGIIEMVRRRAGA